MNFNPQNHPKNETFPADLASDGMNERGLSVSTLLQKWTPDYPEPNPADPRPACAVQSVSHFILSTCTTIAEVKEALNSIQTVNCTCYSQIRREVSLP
jgi:penicillin V acylase-like amidase (Ntn superfamily)